MNTLEPVLNVYKKQNKNWIKCELYEYDDRGKITGCCVYGAILLVSSHPTIEKILANQLRKRINASFNTSIAVWNNHTNRTYKDIIEILSRDNA